MYPLHIHSISDQALLISHPAAAALVPALEQVNLPGIVDLVPAVGTLLVVFDPLVLTHAQLRRQLKHLALDGDQTTPPREHTIPVHYTGPDLVEVAERCGLTVAEVIALHSAARYTVALIGFLPGFPYLDGLPARLHLPRRATPRSRVPAGAVAIAGAQTGIYPQSSPGGWHLLGTTTMILFDATRTPPALLRVGDGVRFETLA